jgi:phytoene dehydrogenase-like protein
MKIAVMGAGSAGLGAAYAHSRGHEVELFEANAYAGGHTNTVSVSHEIDTGDCLLRTWDVSLAFCEAGCAVRSFRDMRIVLSRAASNTLPLFPATRPSF